MVSKATRALNSALKLRRFRVIPVSPGNQILHLSHLSENWEHLRVLITTDSVVDGSILFEVLGFGIAGVGISPTMTDFISAMFRDIDTGLSTGFAFANPNDVPVEISLTLQNSAGEEIVGSRVTILLPARGHIARFLEQVFLEIQTEHFEGSVVVRSPLPIAAIVLRTLPGTLTTLPVTPID